MSESRSPHQRPVRSVRRRYTYIGIAATAGVLVTVGAVLAMGGFAVPKSDNGHREGDTVAAGVPAVSDGTAESSGAASPSPSATPSGSPSRTSAPRTTVGTGGSSTCPLPAYPTPACAGVPAGTVFTRTVTGDYDATVAGQVIDKWHITGNLNIKAPNVVIKNTQIDQSVFNRFGPGSNSQTNTYPYTISDSTIGPATGCIRAAGLQEANYTATRVHIRGVDHGVDMSEPGHVLVRDSYLVMCWLPASVTPPDGSHVDGIQAYCPEGPCTDLRLSHNTFDMRPDGKGTFVINIKDPNISAVTANDNLLAGGDNYVIVTQWRSGPDLVIGNNRVVNNTWGTAAPASGEDTCNHQLWQGNSIVDIDSAYNVTRAVRPLPCLS